ncbi:hypothetical protein DRP53_01845 [candidate division WOR-3 bacterium]|uniref:HD domain-containing protein n=1 Tax=candidate division WOR-3 bacterium TaxID=2052148 RepID=A0A660SKS5_UNCW3|nr:MAG: hypothetical protein DRP53_01845 [candidate division WOR-3 bacterium]
MYKPEHLFPLIGRIDDSDLARIVISAWHEVQERRPGVDLKKLPFTLLIPTKRSLIDHTNAVTEMALRIGEMKGGLNLNLLIAGGLLHDIGKVLTYEKRGEGYLAGPLEKTLRHPMVGAALIARFGNFDLVHIVYTHSHEGDNLRRSKEAIIIHHCDFIDFELEKRKVQ